MIRFGLFTTLRFFRLFFSPIWQSHFYIATSKGGFEFMIQLVGAVPCSLGLVTKSVRSSQVVPSSQSNNVLNGHFFHRSFYCPPQKQRQLQNVLRISLDVEFSLKKVMIQCSRFILNPCQLRSKVEFRINSNAGNQQKSDLIILKIASDNCQIDH